MSSSSVPDDLIRIDDSLLSPSIRLQQWRTLQNIEEQLRPNSELYFAARTVQAKATSLQVSYKARGLLVSFVVSAGFAWLSVALSWFLPYMLGEAYVTDIFPVILFAVVVLNIAYFVYAISFWRNIWWFNDGSSSVKYSEQDSSRVRIEFITGKRFAAVGHCVFMLLTSYAAFLYWYVRGVAGDSSDISSRTSADISVMALGFSVFYVTLVETQKTSQIWQLDAKTGTFVETQVMASMRMWYQIRRFLTGKLFVSCLATVFKSLFKKPRHRRSLSGSADSPPSFSSSPSASAISFTSAATSPDASSSSTSESASSFTATISSAVSAQSSANAESAAQQALQMLQGEDDRDSVRTFGGVSKMIASASRSFRRKTLDMANYESEGRCITAYEIEKVRTMFLGREEKPDQSRVGAASSFYTDGLISLIFSPEKSNHIIVPDGARYKPSRQAVIVVIFQSGHVLQSEAGASRPQDLERAMFLLDTFLESFAIKRSVSRFQESISRGFLSSSLEPNAGISSSSSNPYATSICFSVGINMYKQASQIMFLNGASQDASIMSQTLNTHHGFKACMLLDEDATRDNILKYLKTELKAMALTEEQRAGGKVDRLVIFWAGHGEVPSKRQISARQSYYLLPHDANMQDLENTAIGIEDLREAVCSLPFQHILIVLDACYSGEAILRTRATGPSLVSNEAFRGKCVQVMTAVSKDKTSLEVSSSHGFTGGGFFTSFLVDSLKGGAWQHRTDPWILSDHIHLNVVDKIMSNKNVKTRDLIPQFGKWTEDDGRFLFFKPSQLTRGKSAKFFAKAAAEKQQNQSSASDINLSPISPEKDPEV